MGTPWAKQNPRLILIGRCPLSVGIQTTFRGNTAQNRIGLSIRGVNIAKNEYLLELERGPPQAAADGHPVKRKPV